MATETVNTGDKTKEVTQSGDKGKAKEDAKKVAPKDKTREESRRSRGNDQRGREVIPGRQILCLPLTQTANRA